MPIGRRFVALMLALMVALSGCGLGPGSESGQGGFSGMVSLMEELFLKLAGVLPEEPAPAGNPVREDLPMFSEIPYARPDLELLMAWLEDLRLGMEAAQTAEAAAEVFRSENPEWDAFSTMYTIAMLRNSADLTDRFYQDEVAWFGKAEVQLELKRVEVIRQMLNADYAGDLPNHLTERELQNAKSAVAEIDESVTHLLERETVLIQEYTSLIGSSTVEVQGKDYALYELYSVPGITAEVYWQAVDDYFSDYLPKAGAIMVELVEVRDELAKELGYGSFVELGYQRMGRSSYGIEDVRRLRMSVLHHLVPYINELSNTAVAEERSYLLSEPQPQPAGGLGNMINAFQTIWGEMSPVTKACGELLFGHELIDLSLRQNKEQGAYTTYLSGYGVPFVFANLAGGDAYDVIDLSHEFGHAVCYYHQTELRGAPDFSATLDTSEVFSTAMELLTTQYYTKLYGDKAATASRYALLNILDSMITSAIYDEFNERLYTELPTTPEEISVIYDEVFYRYSGNDMSETYDITCGGRYWIMVQHFFSSPFYSIDYTLANVVALQLWQTAKDDPEAGMNRYLELIDVSYEQDFMGFIEAAKLKNPFDDKVVKSLVDFAITEIEAAA